MDSHRLHYGGLCQCEPLGSEGHLDISFQCPLADLITLSSFFHQGNRSGRCEVILSIGFYCRCGSHLAGYDGGICSGGIHFSYPVNQKKTTVLAYCTFCVIHQKLSIVSQAFFLFYRGNAGKLFTFFPLYSYWIWISTIIGGDKLKQTSVVLCDSDGEYLQAFASYLAGHVPWLEIVSYSCQEEFLQDERTYEIGILTAEFLQVLEFSGKDSIKRKLYLSDDDLLEEYRHLPMVYKYQSMEVVVEMLKKLRSGADAGRCFASLGNSLLYGIYSPICHELQLPFALSLCRILAERGSVLFLDIEELSVLSRLIERAWDRDLLDILYVSEGSEGREPELSAYIRQFMGIDYLPPFGSPEDINEVTREQWQRFFERLNGLSYTYIVILFGRTMPGFREMAASCQELLVLNKPGDFYQKSQSSFLEYAGRAGLDGSISCVQLPMSAGNLSDGRYLLEELLQGNLGIYVRRQIEEGIILREKAAANGSG